MGLGDEYGEGHFSTPVHIVEDDKLKWRKDVKHWARTDSTCAEG